MKNTYDLTPGSAGYATAWRTGYFEELHEYGSWPGPFPADDYVTIEAPRAFYRIHRRDLDNWQIKAFLTRANRLSPKE